MSPSYAPSHDSANMAAAVALIPPRQPARRSLDPVSLPQRPKLQINTQQLRTFGKGSSLRLDTLSAVSPTVRNTFSNAYEAPASSVPSLDRPPKPRLGLSIDSSVSKLDNSNPPSSSTPSSASTLSSALTASSNESATIRIPYKQPHNLVSILSNSPARALIPRRMTAARPLFPAEKRVSFRTPLEEEIKTSKYTLAHSDLQSSTSSESTIASTDRTSSSGSDSSSQKPSDAQPSSDTTPSSTSTAQPPNAALTTPSKARSPQIGDKRDSSESDSDSAPETPVAGRRKRRRDWRWTLGPLPSTRDSSASTASTSDALASEDDSS
ncbi:hypothetical protein M011DRAFT_469117 [Sporormia fimetaria CBS 119925]|uniref:Uncharacterized protein n=1 Tax=Sporormia fimetaria CBS 119925 TaxID=1340428 RepID=A0A6A6V5K8_9PLEO|nr:hypothetical protein M011DRAFT_469117 [Sporormia fimetaria CBS 119925]